MMIEGLRQHVEYLRIAELKPYARNPRTHSPAQVERIAASMREFGFTNPVLINGEGEVIAGHGRLLAAQRLGMGEVPAIRLEHLTPAQVRAYRLADNQLTLLGEWDEELLSGEVQGLAEDEFDLGVLGFGEEELAGLLGQREGEEETLPPVTLADRFGIPPFSVLNAREGWWQDRKRAWIALGIQSELGRGEGVTWGERAEITEPGLNYYRNKNKQANATPSGSAMPAADYGKSGARGDGRGRALTPGGGKPGGRSVGGHAGKPKKDHFDR